MKKHLHVLIALSLALLPAAAFALGSAAQQDHTAFVSSAGQWPTTSSAIGASTATTFRATGAATLAGGTDLAGTALTGVGNGTFTNKVTITAGEFTAGPAALDNKTGNFLWANDGNGGGTWAGTSLANNEFAIFTVGGFRLFAPSVIFGKDSDHTTVWTFTPSTAKITAEGGLFDFDNDNILTTGSITGGALRVTGTVTAGAFVGAVTNHVAAGVITTTETTVILNSTSGAFQLTLPQASTVIGKVFYIWMVADGGDVTLRTYNDGTETFDGLNNDLIFNDAEDHAILQAVASGRWLVHVNSGATLSLYAP